MHPLWQGNPRVPHADAVVAREGMALVDGPGHGRFAADAREPHREPAKAPVAVVSRTTPANPATHPTTSARAGAVPSFRRTDCHEIVLSESLHAHRVAPGDRHHLAADRLAHPGGQGHPRFGQPGPMPVASQGAGECLLRLCRRVQPGQAPAVLAQVGVPGERHLCRVAAHHAQLRDRRVPGRHTDLQQLRVRPAGVPPAGEGRQPVCLPGGRGTRAGPGGTTRRSGTRAARGSTPG